MTTLIHSLDFLLKSVKKLLLPPPPPRFPSLLCLQPGQEWNKVDPRGFQPWRIANSVAEFL